MNIADIRKLLDMNRGKFFTVVFVKKDGSVRKMNCRTGVKRYLKGGRSTLEGKENMYVVFDVRRNAYRAINLDTISSIRMEGVEVSV